MGVPTTPSPTTLPTPIIMMELIYEIPHRGMLSLITRQIATSITGSYYIATVTTTTSREMLALITAMLRGAIKIPGSFYG